MRFSFGALACLCLLGLDAASAEEPAPPVVVVDAFDDAMGRWQATGVDVKEAPVEGGTTASGGECVWLSDLREGGGGWIERKIETQDWRSYQALTLHLAAEGTDQQQLRVIVFGGGGRRAMVRRFRLELGPWREVRLALPAFRSENSDVLGGFEQVERIRIRWDQGTGKVGIDDLRLVPGDRGLASSRPSVDQWREVAFGPGQGKAIEGKRFVLLTDEPALQGEDGRRLLARLEEGLTVLTERYGVPDDSTELAPLAVFRSREAYTGFPPRLGDRFGANVPEPKSDGYTVLGIASSWYDPKQGWDRPVFVHEAMHAALERRIGIASNGNWVQEGLASAVQVTVHPKSMQVDMGSEMRKLRDGQKSLFGPWSEILGKPRPSIGKYAQLVTVVGFLREKHREALPRVWKAVSSIDGPVHEHALPAIASALGTTPADLEKAWLAWGPDYYRR